MKGRSFILADSGSTKTAWVYFKNGIKQTSLETTGLNASYLTKDQLKECMNAELPSSLLQIKDVPLFFYGAGCSGEIRIAKMKSALHSSFPNLDVIDVRNDLYAAARAALKDREGIVGIMGTGSNVAHYDGNELHRLYESPGYLIGDEGGGVSLGRELLKAYLYKELDSLLLDKFYEKYQLTDDEIIVNLYQSDRPNKYMAAFSPFLLEHKNHTQIVEIILGCLRKLFENWICKYNNHQKLELAFVGSIAFYYKEFLEVVAKEFGTTLGLVIDAPMKELIQYHLNY